MIEDQTEPLERYRIERVPIGEIALGDHPPPRDEVFTYLLGQALCGQVEIFFAAVPMSLIEPFDRNYDPAEDERMKKAIHIVFKNWSSGGVLPVWLYPRDDKYILSDDYVTFAAAQKGQPDYLPAYILGGTPLPGTEDVSKPFSRDEVRRILGF